MNLKEIPLERMIDEFNALAGVRVYDEELDYGRFKIGMTLPDERNELTAVIDVYRDRSYLMNGTELTNLYYAGYSN